MIITKEIRVKITEQNINHFENLGYETALGEEISIPVELLTSGSHHRIRCKCDSCGIEKDVIYKNYIKYDNNWGEYKCRKCSESKRKESLKKSLGVEYPIQNIEIKKRILSRSSGTKVTSKQLD
jgi:hypothetical protein